MKNKLKRNETPRLFLMFLSALGICIFIGLVLSFRSADGLFGFGGDFSERITFENAVFSKSLKKALMADFVFCIAVFLFGTSFPASVLPGGYILIKGFLMGCTAGLSARYCIMKEALEILFAIFISNVLVMPICILLFLTSVRFSYGAYSPGARDRTSGYAFFGLRVAAFFALICIAEVMQIGAGILVLK